MANDYIDCEYWLVNEKQATFRYGSNGYSGEICLDEKTRDELFTKSSNLTQYGEKLFQAIFPEGSQLLKNYNDVKAIANEKGAIIRFRLNIALEPTDKYLVFNSLNWETLRDTGSKEILSRSDKILFSRFLLLGHKNDLPIIKESPKILFIISNPTDLPEEFPKIKREDIRNGILENFKKFSWQIEPEFLDTKVTASKVKEELTHNAYHAIHIYAHGYVKNEVNYIILEDDKGETAIKTQEEFQEMFPSPKEIRLVTLSVCFSAGQNKRDAFSGLAHSLLEKGYPSVIAMKRILNFDTDEVFTHHFYKNLAQTGQLDFAVNMARSQLSITMTNQWDIVALYMQLFDPTLWQPKQLNRVQSQPLANENWIDTVISSLRRKTVVALLGPGMNTGFLPTNSEIASQWTTHRWAQDYAYHNCNIPENDRNDLVYVSSFMAITKGRIFPHEEYTRHLAKGLVAKKTLTYNEIDTLSDVIKKNAVSLFREDPSNPYLVLSELPISTFITTNPDSFMLEALRYKNKNGRREVCRWSEDYIEDDANQYVENQVDRKKVKYESLVGTETSPLLFHLYGYDLDPPSLVLTEDDHLEFLRLVSRERWRIPTSITGAINKSTLLFLGFDPRSLGFKTLFKSILQSSKAKYDRIAVIQLLPDEYFLSTSTQKEKVYKYLTDQVTELDFKCCVKTVRDFLIELKQVWEGTK